MAEEMIEEPPAAPPPPPPPPPTPPLGREHCRICRRPIETGAKKCTECDSYQDWRRHLSVSSSVLALLVALVSVLGWAGPILKEMLTPKNSRIEISRQALRADGIYVMATNSGIRAGSVVQGALILKRNNRQITRLNLGEAPVLLRPGETKQIVYTISDETRRAIDREWVLSQLLPDQRLTINFRVLYLEFSGERLRYDEELWTPGMITSAGTKWHQCMMENLTPPTHKANIMQISYECRPYPYGDEPWREPSP